MIRATAITKAFPGVVALDRVDFSASPGEIHALMGENGAGKSTLVRVLTGVDPPDAGEMVLGGRPYAPRSPREAESSGIGAVYQEAGLVPSLSVAENLLFGREPRRLLGRIDRRRRRDSAEESLRRLGLAAIDVERPAGAYPVAVRQLVAIARALDADARVLVLDEPTSSLEPREVERLFETLRRLRGAGLAIVFITHFLEQVEAIADRVTVLRNGRRVETRKAADFPRAEIVAAMLGRAPGESAAGPAAPPPAAEGAPFLRAKGIGRRRALAPIDFEIRPGEVVGLAGLLGSGRTELARLLFGLDRADFGTVEIEGKPVLFRGPRDAIARGLGFCPEDRHADGIVAGLSVRENVVLAVQARRGLFRRVGARRAREIADRFIRALRIKTPSGDTPVESLSGGNQQKVILARWLASSPRLLVLDEPTRGIDVGAKAEILSLVGDLAREGLALVFISAELKEVARTSHRVVVLRDRKKAGEVSFSGPRPDVASIARLIAGGEDAARE